MGFFSSNTCDLCGAGLKRNSYQVAVRGRALTVCPNCYRGLAKTKSKQALQKLLDPAVGDDEAFEVAEQKKKSEGRLNFGCFVIVLIIAVGLVINAARPPKPAKRPPPPPTIPGSNESTFTITVPADETAVEPATPSTDPDGSTPGVRRVR